jgi:hypothetical protein
MAFETPFGLQYGPSDAPDPFSGLQWAPAAGSSDAIVAAFPVPITALVDGMLLGVRAAYANTSPTPTFAPSGMAPHVITRDGGLPLVSGDIHGPGYEMLLRYNEGATRWELLNPTGRWDFFRWEAGQTGENSSALQPWFVSEGALLLPTGSYDFVGLLRLSRSAGTTSHTTSVAIGGTATFTINYLAEGKTGDANDLQTISGVFQNSSSAVVVKAASTSATEQTVIRVKGVFQIVGAGTIVPQFQYSAAPGGAPTITANFRVQRLRSNRVGVWS